MSRKGLLAALGLSSALAVATPTWSVVHGPSATGNWLSAVSCAGRSFCAAVGQSGSQGTLAEVWNGTGWRLTPTPKLRARESSFSDVGCVSRDWCMAIGSTGIGGNLVEHWNGVDWRVMPAPKGSWNSDKLSCVSASYCMAVSSIEIGSTNAATAAIWNGFRWIKTTVPGALGENLNDVSCKSWKFCVAVGVSEGTFHPYAVQWNGTKWVRSHLTATRGFLTAVSCWSSNGCLSVGDRAGTHGLVGFAEMWNGRQWFNVKVSPTKQTSDPFFDTSCWSDNSCVVVGSGTSPESRYDQPIAFEWHGRSIFNTTTPKVSGGGTLDAVAVSGLVAVAVGSVGDSQSVGEPLIEKSVLQKRG